MQPLKLPGLNKGSVARSARSQSGVAAPRRLPCTVPQALVLGHRTPKFASAAR